MLHEILISLSGLNSPIFDRVRSPEGSGRTGLNNYVSPPEQAMLESLSHLQKLHIQIRDATTKIAVAHQSMVCRAIASAISNVHLRAFMDKIVEVETSILKKDAAWVGAYDIVPLSTLVNEFTPWTRRFDWLSSIVHHLEYGPKQSEAKGTSTGKSILDLLEQETLTGYSDIEEMALALQSVGQRAWMRPVTVWVLYGSLPNAGLEDFCIKPNPNASSVMDVFMVDDSLLPTFVHARARAALLATGNALSQLRSQAFSAAKSLHGPTDPSALLLSSNLQLLDSIRYPINPSTLQTVLTDIDQSISEKILSQILPISMTQRLLHVLLRYMLLDHGEFALLLITHADAFVSSQQNSAGAARPVRKIGRLDDLAIKEGALVGVLNKTMAELAILEDDDEAGDIHDFAKGLLSLKLADRQRDQQLVSTMFPTPTLLCLELPPSSPLHIFLPRQDIQKYSLLNAYLLSIRRAGLHLAGLWKLTSQRRCHPTPVGPPRSASQPGLRVLSARRPRDTQRNKQVRRYWTSASKALFLINELEAYLQGEAVQSSWAQLQQWISGRSQRPFLSAQSSRPGTASSSEQSRNANVATEAPTRGGPHDPRALAEAHHRYLEALADATFLTNRAFIDTLKAMLSQIDHFVALFSRLQNVWQGLDLQEDDGVLDAFSNYIQDEKDVLAEMDRTRATIELILVEVVDRIRDVEKQRRSSGHLNSMADAMSDLDLRASRFTPWEARTVDRLIMKLENLTGKHTEEDGPGEGFESDGMYDEE